MNPFRYVSLFGAIVVLLGCNNEFEDMPLTDKSNDLIEVETRFLNYDPNADWTRNSKVLDSPRAEIYFLLNDGSNFHDKHAANFLLPDIPRKYEDKVSTTEILGNEQKIVEYYKQITSAAKLYKIEFTEISHLFWLRFIIYDLDGNELYNFMYSDTLDQIINFQEWVKLNNNQEVFSDMDQGWAIEAIIKEGNIHLLQSDPDNGGNSVNRYLSQEYLNSEMTSSVQAARDIIKVLSESLGEDVWTKYRGYEWDAVNF